MLYGLDMIHSLNTTILNLLFFQVQELIINKDPSLLDNFLDVSPSVCSVLNFDT